MSRPLRRTMARLAAAVTAGALAGTAVLAVYPGVASAATLVHAKYKVSGSTFLKSPNFTLALGPGTLSATVNAATGRLTANLSLPNATGSFKQFGIIPVTATTKLINDGPTTGKVNTTTGTVKTTSKITMRIVSLTVAGLGVPVGSSCETSTLVVVRLASQPKFNILKGGKMAGTYTIPNFSNCGLATALINVTIPGSGNTITFKLGKAKIG
ncbi:MAG: hypothetical protein ACLQFR_13535 [Streptosporangiaceae bacterium]